MRAFRRLLLVVVAVPAVVFALGNCGENNKNNAPPDAGGPADSGTPTPDSGTPDSGMGTPDAGNPNLTCDLATQDCDAGSECLLIQLMSGDFGSACRAGACDLVKQDCGGGNKCTYVASDGGSERGCTGAGTATEGQPCSPTTTSNSCAAGLICLPKTFSDGGTADTCFKFCNTTSDCSGGEACFVVVEPPGNDERPLVCDHPCALFGQDCPPGAACYPGPEVPGCYPEGTIALGQPCTFSDQCVKGAACIGGTCAQLCELPSGMPACTSGSCQPIMVPNVPDAGACL